MDAEEPDLAQKWLDVANHVNRLAVVSGLGEQLGIVGNPANHIGTLAKR